MLFVRTVIANLHNRRSELTLMVEKTFAAEGIRIPDSSLAREMHPVIALVTAGVEMDVLKAMQSIATRSARRWCMHTRFAFQGGHYPGFL